MSRDAWHCWLNLTQRSARLSPHCASRRLGKVRVWAARKSEAREDLRLGKQSIHAPLSDHESRRSFVVSGARRRLYLARVQPRARCRGRNLCGRRGLRRRLQLRGHSVRRLVHQTDLCKRRGMPTAGVRDVRDSQLRAWPVQLGLRLRRRHGLSQHDVRDMQRLGSRLQIG